MIGEVAGHEIHLEIEDAQKKKLNRIEQGCFLSDTFRPLVAP